jgi:hypothetical protein
MPLLSHGLILAESRAFPQPGERLAILSAVSEMAYHHRKNSFMCLHTRPFDPGQFCPSGQKPRMMKCLMLHCAQRIGTIQAVSTGTRSFPLDSYDRHAPPRCKNRGLCARIGFSRLEKSALCMNLISVEIEMTVHAKNINIAEVVKNDIAHHFHPFTDHKAFHADGGPRVMTQADGIWIWDGNGNKLLDGMSGLWCVNVGYGRKELADAAYQQMLDLPYYNTFFKTTTVPTTDLATKISSVMPERFKHIFFTNSGSESNDTIVRFVRHYWKLKGKPYRQHFIARTRGYHGSTMVAANLGGFQGMHDQVGTEFPGFHHVQQPYWYDFGGDKTPEEFGLDAAAAEVEKKILEVGPDNVAAFIGEPIQGAGGRSHSAIHLLAGSAEDLPEIRHPDHL